MARYLAGVGHLMVTVDHVGVGDSSRPTDGFSLTPQVVADVDAAAVDHLKDLLVGDTCCDDLSPVTAPTWIGLGHSMGAKLAIAQQARHRLYDGLALVGIGARGLNTPNFPIGKGWIPVAEPGILTDEVLAYVHDPEGLRGAIVALGRSRYGSDALPQGTTATSDLLIAGMSVPPEVLAAIAASSTSLLG
jgi:pimeloyl-ACP methyl ester carboxylesterase